MRASLFLAVASFPQVSVCAIAPKIVPSTSRRTILRGGVHTTATSIAALIAGGHSSAATASMTESLREAEAGFVAAKGPEAIANELGKILDVAENYDGIPSKQLKEELIGTLRTKRSALLGDTQEWGGVPEEAYNRVVRAVDPWRVIELQPVFQTSILLFAPVYVAVCRSNLATC